MNIEEKKHIEIGIPTTSPETSVMEPVSIEEDATKKLAEILDIVKEGVASKEIGFVKEGDIDNVSRALLLKNRLDLIEKDLRNIKTGTKEDLLMRLAEKRREYFNIIEDESNEKIISNTDDIKKTINKIERKLKAIAEDVATAFLKDMAQMKKDMTSFLDRVRDIRGDFDLESPELAYYINQAGILRNIITIVENKEYKKHLDDIDAIIEEIIAVIEKKNAPKTETSVNKKESENKTIKKPSRTIFSISSGGRYDPITGRKAVSVPGFSRSSAKNKTKQETKDDFGSFIKTPTIDKGDFDDLDLGENTAISEGFEENQKRGDFVSKLSEEYGEKEKTSEELLSDLIKASADKEFLEENTKNTISENEQKIDKDTKEIEGKTNLLQQEMSEKQPETELPVIETSVDTNIETKTETPIISPEDKKVVENKIYSFIKQGVLRGTGAKFWVDAYDAIYNKSGDIRTFLDERKEIGKEKERIQEAMNMVLEYAQKRRAEKEASGIEVSAFIKKENREKEETETQKALRESIEEYKTAIKESTKLPEEKKEELEKQLAYMIAEHTNNQQRLGFRTSMKQSSVLTHYLESKVKTIDVVKNAITGILTPLSLITGPIGRGVRGAVYAGISLYQKGKGESTEYNIKGQKQKYLRRKIETLEKLKGNEEKRAEILARHEVIVNKEKHKLSKEDFDEEGNPVSEKAKEVIGSLKTIKMNRFFEIQKEKEKAIEEKVINTKTGKRDFFSTEELITKEKEERSSRIGTIMKGYGKSTFETARALFGRGFSSESTTKGRDFAQALGRVATGVGIAGPVVYDLLHKFFGEDIDVSFKSNAIVEAQEKIEKTINEENNLDVSAKENVEKQLDEVKKLVDQKQEIIQKLSEEHNATSSGGGLENIIKPTEHTVLTAPVETTLETTNISHGDIVNEVKETNLSTLKPIEVQAGDSMWKIINKEVAEQVKFRGMLGYKLLGLSENDFDSEGMPLTEDAQHTVDRLTAEILHQNHISDKLIIHPGDDVTVEYDADMHRNIIKINGEEIHTPIEKDEIVSKTIETKDIGTKNNISSDEIHKDQTLETKGGGSVDDKNIIDENAKKDVGTTAKEDIIDKKEVKTTGEKTDKVVETTDKKDVIDTKGKTDLAKETVDTKGSATLDSKFVVEKNDFKIEEGNIVITPKGMKIDLDEYSSGAEKIEADYFNKSDNVLLTMDKGNGVKECLLLDQLGGRKLDIVFGKDGLHPGDNIMISGQRIETEDSFKNMSLSGKYPNVIIDGKKAILKITETGLFAKKQGEKIDIPIARFDE